MELDNIINSFDYNFHSDYENFLLKLKRNINSPWFELKEYQYKIKEYLENKYSFLFFITWYRKWISINNNASIHLWKNI